MFKLLKSNTKLAMDNVAMVNLNIVENSATLSIGGTWAMDNSNLSLDNILKEFKPSIKVLNFDTIQLKDFDSSLISYLFGLMRFCRERHISFELDTLPDGIIRLLKLAGGANEAETNGKTSNSNLVVRVGQEAIDIASNLKDQTEFVGEITQSLGSALLGRARYRVLDLISLMQKTGPEALAIVGLISFLVGLILSFVGAVQLAKYGSEIFVADLVGIAMVREMGAIMVAIVMSGRTGASFAAELGSMKVNEEISAFKTFGISPMEFLVLPRILALVMMFPLLTIFADVIGILGGMVIGVGMFDLNVEQYLNRTMVSLNLLQCSTGLVKSFIFGIVIAAIGCQKGMACENSSAGVGMATTSSVVQSITWIIVIDAVFAVAFNIFGI